MAQPTSWGQRATVSAHGGCQSRCPLFWKDVWLERVAPNVPPDNAGVTFAPRGTERTLARKAARSVLMHGRDPVSGTYSCQGTEVLNATTQLPFWSPRQYWDDVRSGNVTFLSLLIGIPIIAFNKFQSLSRRFLPRRLWIRGGLPHPVVVGKLEQSPDVRIGIAIGETVEIESHRNILETLDAQGHNRGLAFDGDMVPYCGKRASVHHRVEARIDERTGRLRPIQNPCLVLDGVVCQGRYHRFSPAHSTRIGAKPG